MAFCFEPVPFFVLYGQSPRQQGIDSSSAFLVSSLDEWLQQKAAMQALIQQQLAWAKSRMKLQADKNRTKMVFSIGTWVYITFKLYVQSSWLLAQIKNRHITSSGLIRLWIRSGPLLTSCSFQKTQPSSQFFMCPNWSAPFLSTRWPSHYQFLLMACRFLRVSCRSMWQLWAIWFAFKLSSSGPVCSKLWWLERTLKVFTNIFPVLQLGDKLALKKGMLALLWLHLLKKTRRALEMIMGHNATQDSDVPTLESKV